MGEENLSITKVAALLVVGLVVGLGIGYGLSFAQISSLQSQISQLQSKYREDTKETVNQDMELLLGLMSKLAKVSEDKYLKTNVQTFSLMCNIFSELAKSKDVEEHKRILYLEHTKNVFAKSPSIQRSYDKVCGYYDELVKFHLLGIVEIKAYQTILNKLVMALVELDNAISSDP